MLRQEVRGFDPATIFLQFVFCSLFYVVNEVYLRSSRYLRTGYHIHRLYI